MQLQVTLPKLDKRLCEITLRQILHTQNGNTINFHFISILAANSDSLFCFCVCSFLSHSFTYSPCSLLFSFPFLCSLHPNFLVLIPIYVYFWEAQLHPGSLLLLTIILAVTFSCPKLRLKKTPDRKFKPASSKSSKVWSSKRHVLVLKSSREFLLKSAISISPLTPSFYVGAGNVPEEVQEEKGHIQVVKMCICWTKDQITTYSFPCLTNARISLQIIAGLWCWINCIHTEFKGS